MMRTLMGASFSAWRIFGTFAAIMRRRMHRIASPAVFFGDISASSGGLRPIFVQEDDLHSRRLVMTKIELVSTKFRPSTRGLEQTVL